MKKFFFNIAGFIVSLEFSGDFTTFDLPKALAPFALSGTEPGEPLFTLRVELENPSMPVLDGLQAVATGINDLGEARLFVKDGVYAVALSPCPGAGFRIMTMNPGFTLGVLFLQPGDPYAAFTIDSMLRILFSQAIVPHEAFLLHASAVTDPASGRALLFMGKSGTGKSTHAALWQRVFPGVELLNDDNPVVRLLPDGTARAYGSPWSGKTRCYRNASAPLAAFVRLSQAPCNSFTPLTDIDAFVAILPGVSVITHSRSLYDKVCSTVIEATRRTRVGALGCLPDADAPLVCRAGVFD